MPNFYAYNCQGECWEGDSANRWARLRAIQEKGTEIRLAWMDDDVFLEVNHDGPAQPGIVCDVVVQDAGAETFVQVVADNGQIVWMMSVSHDEPIVLARTMAEAMDVIADNEAILRHVYRL
jgi:hypothetical protein